MRRGTPLAHVLARCGEVIRRRPDSLGVEARAKLFRKSEECARFDIFLSHSWRANGLHKYLALLVHLHGKSALLLGVVGAVLVAAYQFCFGFPLGFFGRGRSPWDEGYGRVSLVEYAACIGLVWLGLFAGHRLLPSARKQCFLDCTCIAQTDEKLKQRAVGMLSGYLNMSDRLLLLWDPSYFSRLWCVYELAAYHHFSPAAPIDVLPLRLAVFVVSTQVVQACSVAVYLLLTSTLSPYLEQHNYLVVFLPQLLMCTPALAAVSRFGARFRREQQTLVQQLEAFDARSAAATVATDRETILRSIGRMYRGGVDEFNAVVRTKLLRRVGSTFNSQRALLPYSWALLALAPKIGLMLSVTVTFADNNAQRPDAPFFCTWAVCALGWVLAGFPLMLALAMHSGQREAGVGRHLAVGLAAACAVAANFFFASLLPMRAALPTDAPPCALGRSWLPEAMVGDCFPFPRWAAPLLAAALNAPSAAAAWWFYRRRTVAAR